MFYGWRVVSGALVSQLFVAGFFTYSVSLLVAPVRAEFGVNVEQVMYSLSLATLLGLFMVPIGGVLVDRYPVRWLMCLGALIYSGGLWGMSQAQTITQYVVCFGFAMSLPNALAGPMSCSAVVSRWFGANRGKALGIAALGTSIGGVIVPMLFEHWLGTHGWRGALQLLAACGLLLMLPIIAFTIRGKPEDVGLEPEPEAESGAANNTTDTAMSVAQIVRSPDFWLLGLSIGILFSGYSSFLSNLAPYATQLGESESRGAALITIVAVAGFIGKLIFGTAADRFNLKFGLWAAQALVACAFLILSTEPAYLWMCVAAGSMGLAAGGMLPVWGAMTARIFGLLSYGRAMGLMGPVLTLCILPGFSLVGRLYDTTGSYASSLLTFAALLLVSAALLLPLKFDRSPG
jgi:predicted MFS family arabinose efflux permease